jgi:diguanylate cyclase (GGDEF)-like protein
MFAGRRVAIMNESGNAEYVILTQEDITERRQNETRIAHMAFHDTLTQMPNRAAFTQSLNQMIDACAPDRSEFAVLSIDLDRFKEINDVFGHGFGDKLLKEVARSIQVAAGGAAVARLSGDEFALIIDGPQPESGRALAERLIAAMRNDFQIDGKTLRVGLTCGMSVYPRDGEDAGTLLTNADVALYRAKAEGRGSVRVFLPEMDQLTRDRRALHQDLSNAIKNNELSLFYQPQARTSDRQVVGFEALVRWHHPVRGVVSPGMFIPIAEESTLIVDLGEWVLREACREAASWAEPMQIAVNLSPVQFLHGDLVGLVHAILLETGLSPARLELEITEGVLIRDFDRGVSLLRRLKALGVHIAMDDFGSGYSSLSYLQSFPFDKIKIDRAFVKNIGRNPQSAAIIRAVVGLGQGLATPIVAEGVETAEQLEFLTDVKCDQVQGYFIGMPEPIAHYSALVGRGHAEPRIPRARLVG